MRISHLLKHNKGYYFIALLVLVAALLAFLNFKQMQTPKEQPIDTKRPLENRPTSSEIYKPKNASAAARLKAVGFNDEEIAVLIPPPFDASKEERDSHFDLVFQLAKEADVLDLDNCKKPNPLVLKVKTGSEIKVKNSSSQDYQISFGDKNQFTIAENTTTTIKPDYKHVSGIYAYSCKGIPGIVGLFLGLPDQE